MSMIVYVIRDHRTAEAIYESSDWDEVIAYQMDNELLDESFIDKVNLAKESYNE